MDWFPLYNSLRISLLSSVIVFFLGIRAAEWVIRMPNGLQTGFDVLFTLPLVLPPTVVGFLLLKVFSPNRLIGKWIWSWFQIRITMTWWSAVIATIVVIFPLMYRTARGAFEGFDQELTDAGRIAGAPEHCILWKIKVPACKHEILAGSALAFARALGEYGATSMIAGYTPGRTATISTTVYQLWRTNDDATAFQWVLVNILLSAVVLFVLNRMSRRNKKGKQR